MCLGKIKKNRAEGSEVFGNNHFEFICFDLAIIFFPCCYSSLSFNWQAQLPAEKAHKSLLLVVIQ